MVDYVMQSNYAVCGIKKSRFLKEKKQNNYWAI